MHHAKRSMNLIARATIGTVGLGLLTMAVAAGCSVESTEETAAPPAQDSAGAAPSAYQRSLVHDGKEYTFSKTVLPGGEVERKVERSEGTVLTEQEVDTLERVLWEKTRAPRVEPELRAAAAAGEARDVVLYGNGDEEETRQVARDLGLSEAELSQRGQLPGAFLVHAGAGRLAELVRAADEGRIANLDIPRAVIPKGPLDSLQVTVPEQMHWIGQDVAVKMAHFPEDGLPPGAPSAGKGLVGLYFECPLQPFGSLTATYNPRGPECPGRFHGDAIANIVDQFITIPGRGPFTNQIAYEQSNDVQEILGATSWYASHSGSDLVTVINASNSQFVDGYAPPTINANDRLVDRLTASSGTIWVQATGDLRGAYGQADYCHHTGFSAIKTGWAERNTDGTFLFHGAVKNPTTPHADRELPEIIAPGYGSWPSTLPGATGSSAAVPMLAGIIATMQSRDTFLRTSPASVRALLLMSAWKQPGAQKWADAVGHTDLQDGAGMVSATAALLGALGGKHSWEVGKSFQADAPTGYFSDSLSTDPCPDPLGCSANRNLPATITFPAGASRIKLGMSWSINDDFNVDPSKWLDLDMSLVDEQGYAVAWSLSYDNNYEVIDAQVDPAHSYTLRVNRYGWNYGTQEYAIAWSREIRPVTAGASESLGGWPSWNVNDGDPATVYSSNLFIGTKNNREAWLAAWTAGPRKINSVVLHPRMKDGVALGFPKSYTIDITTSDNSAWLPMGGLYTTQPQADGTVVLPVPWGTATTYGVLIVPQDLGVDDWGNSYFQMADVTFR